MWTKEQQKQYAHEHYLKNKDKYREWNRKYRLTHKAELVEWQRNYYLQHREIRLEKAREHSLRKRLQRKREKRKKEEEYRKYLHNLSDAVKGYIAAFLDSEGTISTHFRTGSKCPYPRLTFCNTNRDVVEYVKNQLKLRSQIWEINKGKARQKSCFVVFNQQMCQILAILEELKPFLVVKKRHAELLIRLIQLKLEARAKTPDWVLRNVETGRIFGSKSFPYPDKIYSIYQELKSLNIKGPKLSAEAPQKLGG